MRAGKLDRLIDIQRKESGESPSGEPVDTWVTVVARRASSYRPLRGDERYSTPQTVASEQVEFKIRWSQNVAGITPLDRVVYPALSEGETEVPAGRVFNILAANELGRREGISLIGERRADV